MKKTLLIIFALLGISSAFAADITHCSSDENIVFSCSVGKKTASVCASKDAVKDKGYVQYRFGVIGKPEMTFPVKKEPANKNFSLDTDLCVGTPNASGIKFIKGEYIYGIADKTCSGSELGSIEVFKTGKPIASLYCIDDVISNVSASAVGISK